MIHQPEARQKFLARKLSSRAKRAIPCSARWSPEPAGSLAWLGMTVPPSGRGIRPFRSTFAAAALALVIAGCSARQTKPPEEAVPVTVGTVEQKNVPIDVQAIGNVQPITTVAVKALVGGQLTRVWFKEGDDVRRGDMLFSIDPRPLEAEYAQAQANLARDEAALRNAETQARRYADLVKKDFVTKEEYDKITSAAEVARAVVAADRASVETARLQLSYSEIRSPMDGRTGSLQVHTGNIVKANDQPMVTINQISPVYVSFAVPESALEAIRIKGTSNIPVAAAAKNTNTAPALGRLSFVDNAVDPQTGTITLKATFPNRDRTLWPGQFVNVTVTVDTKSNAIVAPARAVQSGQKGQYVYVVKPDHSVDMRPVSVYRTIGQVSIIDKGLTPGETVVTDGQLRLTPKSKVEVKALGS
jgi:multidrug efflux system membrane fusion protein